MRRVVAYDLPVGICESSNDKSFLEQLRRMADWQYSDAYFRTGRHPQYSRPAEVDAECRRHQSGRDGRNEENGSPAGWSLTGTGY
jgi:hypothetical protein